MAGIGRNALDFELCALNIELYDKLVCCELDDKLVCCL